MNLVFGRNLIFFAAVQIIKQINARSGTQCTKIKRIFSAWNSNKTIFLATTPLKYSFLTITSSDSPQKLTIPAKTDTPYKISPLISVFSQARGLMSQQLRGRYHVGAKLARELHFRRRRRGGDKIVVGRRRSRPARVESCQIGTAARLVLDEVDVRDWHSAELAGNL